MVKEPKGVGEGGEAGAVRRVGWLRSSEGGGEAREDGDARWGHLYPGRGYPQCIATT